MVQNVLICQASNALNEDRVKVSLGFRDWISVIQIAIVNRSLAALQSSQVIFRASYRCNNNFDGD